jgi:pimeloyl-ACP methyl ester carboxylesterase
MRLGQRKSNLLMEHIVKVNGLKIRYLRKGGGKAFALLHGMSFCAETWVEMGLFDELAKDYSVYSFDMPYGTKSRSEKFDASNRDEYAEFLKELLKSLGIDEPVLLGASISGEVTLRYLSKGYTAKSAIVAGPVGIRGLVPRLGMITIPLLAMWGEKDNISAPENAEILTGHAKNVEVHIIKNAGHACYLDRPDEFRSLVRDFLGKTN